MRSPWPGSGDATSGRLPLLLFKGESALRQLRAFDEGVEGGRILGMQAVHAVANRGAELGREGREQSGIIEVKDGAVDVAAALL